MSRFLDELEVTPLADGRNWRVNAPFRYFSELLIPGSLSGGGVVTVPGGFTTDFASVPQALWAILPPWQTYGAAAVIHDYLYWSQTTTRDIADQVLEEAMRVLAVEEKTVSRIYGAVHTFGESSWLKNFQLKQSGFERTASPNSTPPYAAII